ncbi:TetR/AcrR family transcriptional regulator [Nocardia takedensis]|uniref:TetR/AcrR family transcriptional regulator n=1 Tax=Nocardia takedensis TaxID=259390 RepID=UPI0005939B8A|nr:TetR/AcrR family transcriptional regulator [Nocardia takedensis]
MSAHLSATVESTRRRLNPKQAETVDRLTRAAVDILRREGFDGLTMRMVATAAGVGTATAYTYFSSKDHLIAEVMWRRLASATPPEHDPDLDTAGRAVAALRAITFLLGDEPEMAKAVTSALLGSDPDVAHLRVRIGLEIRRWIEDALGATASPDLAEALELLYSGALLRAGMGYASFLETADRIEKTAQLLMRGEA